MEVSDEYAPLPQGTHATVRSQSLSGIANRYVNLDLPAVPRERGGARPIEDGGTIEQANTTSEVDLDQLFNTLDDETVASLKSVIKGFARSYDGVGPQANKGFYYLNPFLSTSRRVFAELNSDEADLASLLVDTDSLTGALAARYSDIEALVGNLNKTLRRDRPPRDRARLGDRPAARLHAPVQHHRGQPARRARRRRPAVTASQPGRPQAQALRPQAARLRPRRGADGQGPRRDRLAQGRRQRPDRADRAAGAPRRDRGRPGHPQRPVARGRPARVRHRARARLPRLHRQPTPTAGSSS